MTVPPKRRELKKRDVLLYEGDLPNIPGKCRYGGGYVNDGQVIDYFGVEYVCRAPNLVRTK